MRSLTSRADLLRIAATLGREALAEAARGLGYEGAVRRDEGEVKGSSTEESGSQVPRRPPPSQPDAASVPFWQPRSIEIFDDDARGALVRRIEASEAAAEASRPWERGDARLPTTPPLSPWRRTGVQLHAALTAERAGRRLDVPTLVRRWSRGEYITQLPRRARRAWVPVVVLVDRSIRLVPFWDDQDGVIAELRRVLGAQGLIVRLLPYGPDQAEATSRRWRAPMLCGVPILALGDLGWYGGDEERGAWLRLGRELRAAGQQVHALVPVPHERWTDELARTWRAMPWERPAPGSYVPRDAREARVTRLLRLLGPAMRIEPGLIRTLRLILPRDDADAGTEADLWARPELGEPFPEYRALVPERADELRRAFLRANDEDRPAVMAALRNWHWNEGRQPEAWHLEVLALARAQAELDEEPGRVDSSQLPLDPAGGDLPRAQAFITWLAGEVRAGSPDTAAEGRVAALRTWCRFVGEQERALWSSRTAAGEALQIIGQSVGGVEIPDLDPRLRALVWPPPPEHGPREYPLRQVGGGLETSTGATDELGSPIGLIIAVESVLHLAGSDRKLTLGRPGERLMAPPGGAIELRTDRTTLRMAPLMRPDWARAIGRDGFGLWAELVFEGVSYRMRWIPPGRFVMGSPEGEPGHFEDEEQHVVTITCGYWLGETPVTQALWQAVTGQNPSRFKTPERPVEQVSWDDCDEALIARFNKVIPPERGEFFRLPTEAEWEYACRAGTTGATYAGPIELLGANNAPVLDAIGWYGGNSGVDYDLAEGHDSSRWPDKQHEHSKAGTRRVGQKHRNQWGLHDMLGNVWEWCSDWCSSNSSAAQQDPAGPAAGVYRVIRGGSWGYDARFVRAAARSGGAPGDRSGYLGLRLVRGQGVRQDPGSPEGQ